MELEEKIFVKRKPIKCSKCGFRPISKIIYGYPSYDNKTQEALKSKKIVLGGCCVSLENPLWYCTSCNTNFYLEIEPLEEFVLNQK